ncbi:venom allergen 3-like isoform X4 [Dermacentor andersoni]|uniref:venom allergen 3-like isoform X4 n=1 Tax=Dermacentor andersoni TaxID=34620 RepID=UPI003B3AF490
MCAGCNEKNPRAMRNVASGLLLALSLCAAAVPGDALPSTCRPEYRDLPGGLVHTACKPPNPNCIFVSTGLSAAEKAEVLKAHNDYRSQVAQGRLPGFPAATNMYRLKWDDQLAHVAQAFTNLCDDRHDKEAQRRTSKFPKVGQNIAWNYEPRETQVVDSAGRVKDWFDEYKDFKARNVDPFRVDSGPVVTHFTQVAWAETRYLGCGYTHYKLRDDNDPRLPFKKLFVCHYAPGGNVIRRSMYKRGSACSACPEGTTCDAATGLCTEDNIRYKQTQEQPPHENITTMEPITKSEENIRYKQTQEQPPYENITTMEPITTTKDNVRYKQTQEQPPYENITTMASITKYTPGDSDGLSGSDSGGGGGSPWGILAFFLLGIFATAAVAFGLLYVRWATAASANSAQEPCAV